jgi:hypothetical protein
MKKLLTLVLFTLLIQLGISQPVNTDLSNGLIFDGEPYLAINPTNNQNIVAAWMGMKYTSGLFRILIKTRASFDGGNTWIIRFLTSVRVLVRQMFLWLLIKMVYFI